MMNAVGYRWRKTTDINRECALFELLDGETPLLDMGFTDKGVVEIAFNPCISGRIVELEQFLELIQEGKTLAEQDR